MTQSAIRSRLSRTLSWFLPACGFLPIMRSNPYMLNLTQPSAGIPPFRWTCRITATYASRSAGPGSPNSLPPVTLTYCSKRRPSSVMIVLRASRLSSTRSRLLNRKMGNSSMLTSTWISGPLSSSKSRSSRAPLSMIFRPSENIRSIKHQNIQPRRRTIELFLCVFAGKTSLDLHGRYATFSWTIRYSFLRGTLFVPGGYAVVPGRYAIRFWGVRYFFLSGTPLMKIRWARLSWAVRYLSPVRGTEFDRGYAIYFRARSAPSVAPTSHLWRTHLPGARLALLHQRYAVSAAHVRYGKDKGFMGGTLFLHTAPRSGEPARPTAQSPKGRLCVLCVRT